jgi:hypothetical protein
MRTGSWVFLGVVLLATGAGVSACSSPSGAAEPGGSGGSGADGGACEGATCTDDVAAAGDAGGGGMPDANAEGGAGGSEVDDALPSCVPTGAIDNPDDDFADSNCDGIDGDKSKAIFVSPDGKDTGDGSFRSPVNTITKGVELAGAQSKDVYVCTADYAENVVIDTKAVSIFGGYECADWSRGNARPSVTPASGIGLTVRKVSAVTVDRMTFVAADATVPGTSSIAAQVMASDQVVLSHLDLTSGSGAPGLPGSAVPSVTKRAKTGASGNAGQFCDPYLSDSPCNLVAVTGGEASDATCGSVKIHGGSGGKGAPYPKGRPVLGAIGSPGNKKSGAAGQNGAAGTDGAFPSEGFGSVTEEGYVASNSGTDGLDGAPGQSGGGGNGGYSCHYEGFPIDEIADCVAGIGGDYFYYGSGGGQGGYGGCGGLGGHGGGAGGASLALLSIGSTVSLSWSSLTTGTGGAGGLPSAGAKGQPGGAGGKAGMPTSSASGSYAADTTGQDGGAAGDGGPGGPGGPGGGGPSITLVAVGDMPLTQAVTFTNGAGGKGAPGLTGQDAPSGESSDVKVIDAAPPSDGT